MAQLIMIYDPVDRVNSTLPEHFKEMGVRQAILPIPNDLEGKDIYAIARKFSELVLEQVS